jgi:hypothetical protein
MAKTTDIVAEIAGQIRPRRNMRWHQKVSPEHVGTLDEIAKAYKAGKFGPCKLPAAKAIAATLSQLGITNIKHNMVIQWLDSL